MQSEKYFEEREKFLDQWIGENFDIKLNRELLKCLYPKLTKGEIESFYYYCLCFGISTNHEFLFPHHKEVMFLSWSLVKDRIIIDSYIQENKTDIKITIKNTITQT